MKKLLPIFVLFFAFTLSASAQSDKTGTVKTNEKKQTIQTPEVKAKQDTFELSKAIEMNGDMQAAIYQLFLKKHVELSRANITDAEKQQVYQIIDAKLKATFSEMQIENIKASSNGLYDRLLK